MVARRFYIIVVSIFLCTGLALAYSGFNFSSINSRSDKYIEEFAVAYLAANQQASNKEVYKQIALYKEAYFLLLDNYVYDINDQEKMRILNLSKDALRDKVKELGSDNVPVDPAVLMENIMSVVFNSIDAHTVYMNRKLADDFRSALSGNHSGIGILFNYDKTKNLIFINKVFADSPSQAAGLMKGDYIKAADGKEFSGKTLDEIVGLIRGKSGTVVKLNIIRNNKEILKEIIRGDYYVPSVEYTIINDYAYISIASFNQDTGHSFIAALNSLQVNTLKGLIIDVRNNPGGVLPAVVVVADSILSKETIVSIKGRNTDNDAVFNSFHNTRVNPDLPIVVLTNFGSASASELLAGALSLNNRATVIGDSTFGKWTVQTSFTLKNQSIFNITSQMFYGPKDATFQGYGIAPDIKIIDKDSNIAFREHNYKNYLKVESNYKKNPRVTITENKCPEVGEKKDKVLGCALIYLQSNSDVKTFKQKIGVQ